MWYTFNCVIFSGSEWFLPSYTHLVRRGSTLEKSKSFHNLQNGKCFFIMAFGCQWPKFAFWLIFWRNPVAELSLHAIIDNEKQKCNGSYMKLQWKKRIYYKDLLIIFFNCTWCFEHAYWFLQVVFKQKRSDFKLQYKGKLGWFSCMWKYISLLHFGNEAESYRSKLQKYLLSWRNDPRFWPN